MKVLYTASVLSHICQFHLPMMASLQEQGWEVHVAARDNLAEKNGLQLKNCDRFIEVPFQRSPKDKRNLDALKQLKQLLSEEYYDLIICNTPVCGILTRMAAKETRKKGTKVVYVAHGFHFYKGAPKKYWLLYPIEKFFADRRTDLLVAINDEDYQLASKKFKCRIFHMHGVGVKGERFHPATEEEQLQMRSNNGLQKEDFVVLCTGELLPNKNQKALIDAVALCLKDCPNLKLLLAGNGPEKQNLGNEIATLHLENNVRLLGYRTDLDKLLPAVDVVASCSIREGLPLNIMEGMLCAKPIVASKNRGHNELVRNEETGYLVDHYDIEGFADRLCLLAKDPDRGLQMGKSGYQFIQRYTTDVVLQEFNKMIQNCIG